MPMPMPLFSISIFFSWREPRDRVGLPPAPIASLSPRRAASLGAGAVPHATASTSTSSTTSASSTAHSAASFLLLLPAWVGWGLGEGCPSPPSSLPRRRGLPNQKVRRSSFPTLLCHCLSKDSLEKYHPNLTDLRHTHTTQVELEQPGRDPLTKGHSRFSQTAARVPPIRLVQIHLHLHLHLHLHRSCQEWALRSSLSFGSDSGLEGWVSDPRPLASPLGPALAVSADADCGAVIVAAVPAEL
ncbi:hypothetical protein EYF80_051006 [Liparis tanakae]|uniref:Uncharacterized protein n=1 Tax=Liparis tanakae TaxID=230148 RepID=A0A4Z2FEI4_9TELE|nr:hypothetical protein EYF80_051006 [Liparis tanakae]